MLVEIYMGYGDPQDSKVVIANVTHNLTLSPQELIDLSLSIEQLKTIDTTNYGWVINGIEESVFYFKSDEIDPNIMCCDKGGIIDSYSPGYISLNDLVTSILNRI